MNFELVGWGHATAGVHQRITELDVKGSQMGDQNSIFWVVLVSFVCKSGWNIIPGRTFSAGDPSLRVY